MLDLKDGIERVYEKRVLEDARCMKFKQSNFSTNIDEKNKKKFAFLHLNVY